MQEILVRSEVSEDIRAIDVVNLSAFEGEREARLVSALRHSPGFVSELSLVAEFNGRIVGHALLSKVRLQRSGDVQDILALAPMAVVPSQSHRGIGTELMHAAVDQARRLGYHAIVVVGHPDYYARFGFEHAAERMLESNLAAPQEAIMVRELTVGSLGRGGRVIYPAPFSEIYGFIRG